jgi:hypothetical protein
VIDPIADALDAFVPAFESAYADWAAVLRAAAPLSSDTPADDQSGRRFFGARRRKSLLVVAVAAAALAAVMAATPAWALVRDVLPFWGQPVASQPDQRAFAELNIGAPSGMSPEVVAGDTREVAHGEYGGTTRTLWVAPAKDGGFCELWQPGGGGCTTGAILLPLGWTAMSFPRGFQGSQYAGTEWISGFAMMGTVSDVVIRFSDGTSVHPQIIWVSAPISAGFFFENVPSSSEQANVTEIDAYDANGKLVRRDAIPPMG